MIGDHRRSLEEGPMLEHGDVAHRPADALSERR
jgi:hypothetical protein